MLLETWCILYVYAACVRHNIFYSHISSDDDNRIVLKPIGDCQNDYINASYVDVRIHSLNKYWTPKNQLDCLCTPICLSYRVMKVFINLSLAKVNIVITFMSWLHAKIILGNFKLIYAWLCSDCVYNFSIAMQNIHFTLLAKLICIIMWCFMTS